MGEMMGKEKIELSALAVSRITRRGATFVGGVTGLALNVVAAGSRSWILRYQVGGKRRDLGLGGYPSVTLAAAREAARAARAKLAQGIDPIQDARSARSALIAAQAKAVTFKEASTSYIEAHEEGWRNAKHAAQWRATLETHAHPVLGAMMVKDIELPHVLKVLEPLWRDKTETASRLRGRIESVLDWATVRGHRTGPNPARWKGHLDMLLVAPKKVAKTEHHRALPYKDAPKFMTALRKQEGMGAKALEFVILTAARSGEVRGAKWEEFDLRAGIWTVPGERMKAGRPHVVPLAKDALALVKAMEKVKICEYVFPSPREKMLSDMTLGAVLKRMGMDCVPHGFRSTFRDWVSETTDYDSNVAEMALAHTIPNKVEAAYRRGNLFEKRRALAEDWAAYLSGEKAAAKAGRRAAQPR